MDRQRRDTMAPHTRTTECIGQLAFEGGATFLRAEDGSDGDAFWHDLESLAPAPASANQARGPRGRFRVTVEWWPEQAACRAGDYNFAGVEPPPQKIITRV